mmetsp:Transcript_11978/g.24657  ORF Transcript_11978/g.24657 Transcript_11978/m.24657 type:complete len:346 (-) Transcript_11978:445-1482(-)
MRTTKSEDCVQSSMQMSNAAETTTHFTRSPSRSTRSQIWVPFTTPSERSCGTQLRRPLGFPRSRKLWVRSNPRKYRQATRGSTRHMRFSSTSRWFVISSSSSSSTQESWVAKSTSDPTPSSFLSTVAHVRACSTTWLHSETAAATWWARFGCSLKCLRPTCLPSTTLLNPSTRRLPTSCRVSTPRWCVKGRIPPTLAGTWCRVRCTDSPTRTTSSRLSRRSRRRSPDSTDSTGTSPCTTAAPAWSPHGSLCWSAGPSLPTWTTPTARPWSFVSLRSDTAPALTPVEAPSLSSRATFSPPTWTPLRRGGSGRSYETAALVCRLSPHPRPGPETRRCRTWGVWEEGT